MIDSHVHLRGGDWNYKETVEHGLRIALLAGVDGVVDEPNVPYDGVPIISRRLVEKRLGEAERAQENLVAEFGYAPFYGLEVGLTSDPDQIAEAVGCYRAFSPRRYGNFGVVGLKLFAGHSVGDLSVSRFEDQRGIYVDLISFGYEGVVSVHPEKEDLIDMRWWDPGHPASWNRARPLEAEFYSIQDQLRLIQETNFRGHVHFKHVSTVDSARLVYYSKPRQRVSSGVTPHHLLLNAEMMRDARGLLMKVNPPVRRGTDSCQLLKMLIRGEIDIVESDHAPHTFAEKTGGVLGKDGKPVYMSGIVGLPIMAWMPRILRAEGISNERIRKIMHTNVDEIFGVQIPENGRTPRFDLHTEYETDVYEATREYYQEYD